MLLKIIKRRVCYCCCRCGGCLTAGGYGAASRACLMLIDFPSLMFQLYIILHFVSFDRVDAIMRPAQPITNQSMHLQSRYLPQQVPKNHRMDPNDIPREVETDYSNLWQPSDLPMERFESVKINKEVQWPGPKSEQAPIAAANEWSDPQQQLSKWSIAYNQSSAGSSPTESMEVLPQYIHSMEPPMLVKAEVANQSNKSSSSIPVFFDDDQDKIHQNKMTGTRRSESTGVVSLSEAQKALEENLALQNKLLALLNKARGSPKKVTYSAQYQPIDSSETGGQRQIANSNLISLRQSDQLMRGILPTASLTVQHPRKTSIRYKYRPQADSTSQYRPFNLAVGSSPVRGAASSFTTTTTTTRLPPTIPRLITRDEPLMVDEEDGEIIEGFTDQSLIKPGQTSPSFISLHSDNRFGNTAEEIPSGFENFYSRQKMVNPSALVGYTSSNSDDLLNGAGLIAEGIDLTTPGSYQSSELDSTSVKHRQEPSYLSLYNANSHDDSDSEPPSGRDLDDKWSSGRQQSAYPSALISQMQNQNAPREPNQRRRPIGANRQQQHQQHQRSQLIEPSQRQLGRPLSASTMRYRSGGSNNNVNRNNGRKQHRQFYETASLFNPIQSASYHEISDGSHQVVHVHSKEKKGHGKYLWPIVGGGLTMLMGFLIISNMLLSIPLLAIGASSLFGQGGGGGWHSQQLVPVYNLSQLITTARPSGKRRRRRRKKRWAIGSEQTAAGSSTSSRRANDEITKLAPSGLNGSAGSINREAESSSLLEARIERLIDQIMASGASRLLNFAGGAGWSRRQVLKAAYCHRPNRIRQQQY